MRRIYGVDFSGAQQAGDKIWIAEATITGDRLELVRCTPAKDLEGSGRGRDEALAALRLFITTRDQAAFGMDFPFGLPAELVDVDTWGELVEGLPKWFEDGDQMFHALTDRARALGGDRVLYKRRTEEEVDAPFAAYHWFIRQQTFYGICEILFPLVNQQAASVLPMQYPNEDRAWLLEVCPSSTLRRLGLRRQGYKDSTTYGEGARRDLVDELSPSTITIPEPLKATLIEDAEGDALDSTVAVVATHRALEQGGFEQLATQAPYNIEGYIFE